MKKNLLLTFIIVAIIQLAIPIKMIVGKENILSTGIEYKFHTAPVDPNDPFRGKYITLSFDANNFDVSNDNFWHQDEDVYVLLGKDEKGFAKIIDIAKQPPLDNKSDYVKAKIRYAYENKVTIDYTFNKFFMEESKAPNAESVYRQSARDTSQTAYALVCVKEGDAVLKDVIINGVSISAITGKDEKE